MGTSFRAVEKALLCLVFLLHQVEKSVFDMVEKYENVLLFFLHRYFQCNLKCDSDKYSKCIL